MKLWQPYHKMGFITCHGITLVGYDIAHVVDTLIEKRFMMQVENTLDLNELLVKNRYDASIIELMGGGNAVLWCDLEKLGRWMLGDEIDFKGKQIKWDWRKPKKIKF
ncbi:hypothetical protein ACHQM5_025254 [Ranunculus cassubicifolius]